MPNATRLYQLTQLREQAGLTLADMAQRCGLTGSQARKTVSDWEAGQTTPRASRRVGVMRYLWDDLNLRAEPARFDAIWQMLVEEWAWEPLQPAEWAQLSAGTATPLRSESDGPPPVATPPPASVYPPAAVAEERISSSAPQPTSTDWLATLSVNRHRFLIAIPLLLFVLGTPLWWPRSRQAVPPLPPATATEVATTAATVVSAPIVTATQTIATRPLLLHNGDFEQPDNFAGWDLYESCDFQLMTDGAMAQAGERYLAIKKRQIRCYSFYQEISTRLEISTTYRAAIWLRSPTGEVRRGRLAMWGLDPGRDHNEISFAVNNQTWTCLETTLTPTQSAHNLLKVEIYLDSPDGLDYHFDSAAVAQGEASLCPPPQLVIEELQIVQPSGKIYPAATVGVKVVVKNSGATALTAESYLRYWTAEAEDGSPLDPGTNRIVTVPPLAAGESAALPHLDLYMPINLPTDRGHFVVVDVASTNAPDNFVRGFDRKSHPIQVTPCSPGTLYCDIPADHWAAPEIQAWFDTGISQGCRSNTEPFLNRPFCPDALVQRWMMVFFLMRRLEGKDFKPQNSYQGIFEDVPEDFNNHQGALWIEALTTERVNLISAACPPRGEHRRFCPNDPLRRVDFIRALLKLQAWDLSGIGGKHFVDMETGSQEARAAEYMWQQGFLPENDIDCPATTSYRRFCPNDPLRRATAALMMGRALGLGTPSE